MSKLHVTDDGRVLPCAAQKSCIYSQKEDGNRHFLNEQDANDKASSLLQSRYDMFRTQRKKTELPKRIKNNDRPGNLSLDLDGESCLSVNRFGKMNEVDLPKEHFEDFLNECELSVKS